MSKCDMENLDKNQVEKVVNALQMIADAFQELIAEPDDGEFAVYAPHDGFKTISRAKMEAMTLKEFKKPGVVMVDNSNLAFLFDDYNSFVIGKEDYIYSPIIWGKIVGEHFMSLAEEDYPEVANQMFLRQACATIDEESFFLYRFLGGDEVCVDQSL
ncbi:MAG: hypothetical protein IJF03_06595 [Lachnospiraceae bacterium]|mgnify:CR=1 FL=1|nr:hypothetical protein [Lachnospiraceae bacterium]